MTTSTYVSHIVFDLILSRFKVCDMFPAYVTCMATYTPKRVRRAVALHRSRFQPDLPNEEEEDELRMDGFVRCEAPLEREMSRNHKDKQIVVDDDEAGGAAFPKLSSEIILMVSRSTLKSCLILILRTPKGLLVMNRALDASIQEVRMAQFRAEKADKEIVRLRDELECSRRNEGELVATEIRRAHRRGRREMVEIMKTRRDQFSYDFGELKKGYKAYGNYRECRGIVG
ncbi:hypothetical protein F2Q69_00022897 [Brassica cretica]|uniref:Uncharacterized protein n=1 Tax=Brassica cretica TaxID=69181 RepID=A0A8S9QAS4_BRACR|nr:hypothetical protein F2Q69_00022897 [Brassica cretica]